MLNYIVKFFKGLNSNSNPSQIAHAASIGVLLGLMPKTNALWYILFIFFAFVQINKGFYFVITILVSQIAWHFDPFFSSIGYSILTFPKFENFFSWILDIPFVGFTKFNNTVVMGSLAAGLALYIPVFLFFMLFVKLWRKYISPTIVRSPLMKAVSNLPLIGKLLDAVEDKL